MAKINLNKLKERLDRLSGGTPQYNRTNCFWKPKPGEQFIRIIPNKFNLEDPFTELYFYYYLKRPMLSPYSFGKPDPIMEYVKKLRSTGQEDDKEVAKRLQPTLRIYVPILVRGLEHEGIKFWAFTPVVYKSLVSFFEDEDYGDLSDLMNGRDIKVTYSTKEQAGKKYPETIILPKGKSTPAFDPSNTEIRDLVKNQINILDIFKEPTYDELKIALEEYLNPSEDGEAEIASNISSVAPAPTQSSKPEYRMPENSSGDLTNKFAQIFGITDAAKQTENNADDETSETSTANKQTDDNDFANIFADGK